MDATAPITANSELKNLVHSIERLSDEKDLLGREIAEVYRQAKAKGYDRKALHQVVRLRAQDPAERAQQDKLVATYMQVVELAERQGAAALAERIPYPTKQRLMAGR